jgi:hypothetical protein
MRKKKYGLQKGIDFPETCVGVGPMWAVWLLLLVISCTRKEVHNLQ